METNELINAQPTQVPSSAQEFHNSDSFQSFSLAEEVPEQTPEDKHLLQVLVTAIKFLENRGIVKASSPQTQKPEDAILRRTSSAKEQKQVLMQRLKHQKSLRNLKFFRKINVSGSPLSTDSLAVEVIKEDCRHQEVHLHRRREQTDTNSNTGNENNIVVDESIYQKLEELYPKENGGSGSFQKRQSTQYLDRAGLVSQDWNKTDLFLSLQRLHNALYEMDEVVTFPSDHDYIEEACGNISLLSESISNDDHIGQGEQEKRQDLFENISFFVSCVSVNTDILTAELDHLRKLIFLTPLSSSKDDGLTRLLQQIKQKETLVLVQESALHYERLLHSFSLCGSFKDLSLLLEWRCSLEPCADLLYVSLIDNLLCYLLFSDKLSSSASIPSEQEEKKDIPIQKPPLSRTNSLHLRKRTDSEDLSLSRCPSPVPLYRSPSRISSTPMTTISETTKQTRAASIGISLTFFITSLIGAILIWLIYDNAVQKVVSSSFDDISLEMASFLQTSYQSALNNHLIALESLWDYVQFTYPNRSGVEISSDPVYQAVMAETVIVIHSAIYAYNQSFDTVFGYVPVEDDDSILLNRFTNTSGGCLYQQQVYASNLTIVSEEIESIQCPFNASSRPWYTDATEDSFIWSEVYPYQDGDQTQGLSTLSPSGGEGGVLFFLDCTVEELYLEIKDLFDDPAWKGVAYILEESTSLTIFSSTTESDILHIPSPVLSSDVLFNSYAELVQMSPKATNLGEIEFSILSGYEFEDYTLSSTRLYPSPLLSNSSFIVVAVVDRSDYEAALLILESSSVALTVLIGLVALLVLPYALIYPNRGRSCIQMLYNLSRFQFPLFVLLCTLMTALWASWSAQGRIYGKEAAVILMDQRSQQSYETVVYSLLKPQLAIGLARALYKADAFSVDDTQSAQDLRDQSFTSVGKQFHEGRYPFVQAIYMGFETDGLYAGAQYVDVGIGLGRDELHIMARDPSNEYCYTTYMTSENGTRILDEPTYVSPYCTYDPRIRPWYIDAKAAGAPIFTDVYLYAEGILGITLAVPYYDDDGEFIGVLGGDLNLPLLSVFLAYYKYQGGQDATLFILDLHSFLIADSQGFADSLGLVNATYVSDETISSTTTRLLLKDGGLAGIDEREEIATPIDDPLTYAAPLQYFDSLDWVMVNTVSSNDYFDDIETAYSLTLLLLLLLLGTVTAIFVLFVYKPGDKGEYKDRNKDRNSNSNAVLGVQGNTQEKDRKESKKKEKDFAYWRARVEESVKREFLVSFFGEKKSKQDTGKEKENSKRTNIRPLPSHKVSQKAMESAIRHLSLAHTADHVLWIKLQHSEHVPRLFISLLSLQNNSLYWIILQCCLFSHILLTFFKPSHAGSLTENGVPLFVLIGECVILVLETVHVLISMTALLYLKTVTRATEEGEREQVVSKYLNMGRRLFVSLIVILVLWADWAFIFSQRVSLEYFLPLRCVLVFLLNKRTRQITAILLNTIWQARGMFGLYFCTIIIATITGAALFSSEINPNEISSSYSNFYNAFLTSFVLISSEENYEDVVFASYNSQHFDFWYFCVWILVGTVVLMAMILSVFEEVYTQEFRLYLLHNRKKAQTGLISAFMLIDLNDNGTIDPDEMVTFWRAYWPDFEHLSESSKYLLVGNSALTLETFITQMEALLYLTRLKTYHFPAPDSGRGRLLELVRSPIFASLSLVSVLSQITACLFYGIGHTTSLDILNIVFLVFLLVEVALRAVAFGPHALWAPTDYTFGEEDEDDKNLPLMENEVHNRVDIVCLVISLLGITFCGGLLTSDWTSHTRLWAYLRFFLVLPVARILSKLSSTRKRIYPLFMRWFLDHVVGLLVFLLLVFYVYGIYGVLLFHDKFDRILQGDAPKASFDSMFDSFVALFQMFIGENWYQIMYSGVRTSEWVTAFYALSFFVLMTLLFTNILIASVLSILSKVKGRSLFKYEMFQAIIGESVDSESAEPSTIVGRDVLMSQE